MQRVLAIFFAGILLILAGCDSGPRFIPVKGRVTLDGVPIETGIVQFEAADGNSPSAKGGVITKGEYAAEVPPGDLIVKITGSRVVGTYQVYEGDPNSPVKEKFEQFVPAQFNAETTLKVTVQTKKDDLDFNLKTK